MRAIFSLEGFLGHVFLARDQEGAVYGGRFAPWLLEDWKWIYEGGIERFQDLLVVVELCMLGGKTG